VVVETSGKELVCHYIVVLCLGTKLEFNLGRAALYDKESRHAVICILETDPPRTRPTRAIMRGKGKQARRPTVQI
jgi:hypothetical protein